MQVFAAAAATALVCEHLVTHYIQYRLFVITLVLFRPKNKLENRIRQNENKKYRKLNQVHHSRDQRFINELRDRLPREKLVRNL